MSLGFGVLLCASVALAQVCTFEVDGLTYDLSPLTNRQGFVLFGSEDQFFYRWHFCEDESSPKCQGAMCQFDKNQNFMHSLGSWNALPPPYAQALPSGEVGFSVEFMNGDSCSTSPQFSAFGGNSFSNPFNGGDKDIFKLTNPDTPNPMDDLGGPQSKLLLHVHLHCDHDNLVGDMRIESPEDGVCIGDHPNPDGVTIQFHTYLACPEHALGGSLSWGWHFLFWFHFFAAIYVGGGAAYNFKTKGLKGPDALPHMEFWLEVPNYVLDGIRFVQKKAPLYGASEEGDYDPSKSPLLDEEHES